VLSNKAFSGNPTSDIKHNNVTTYVIPDGDVFYLFFHIGAGSSWNLPNIVRWEYDYTKTFQEAYLGEITMTLVVDGNEVYNGDLGLVENLVPGEYTVTVYADGVFVGTVTVIVEPGATSMVDFGDLFVIGANERIEVA
jgi:hypothetical protein